MSQFCLVVRNTKDPTEKENDYCAPLLASRFVISQRDARKLFALIHQRFKTTTITTTINMSIAQHANEVAKAFGPALTKSMKEDDLSAFQDLFISTEAVSVVLQGAEGTEIHVTIGDKDADMTWQEYQQASKTDLEAQKYQRTEAECVGILGDRMMLNSGRINEAGEVYIETFLLLTLNEQGKITMLEAFTDIGADTFVGAAEQAGSTKE